MLTCISNLSFLYYKIFETILKAGNVYMLEQHDFQWELLLSVCMYVYTTPKWHNWVSSLENKITIAFLIQMYLLYSEVTGYGRVARNVLK